MLPTVNVISWKLFLIIISNINTYQIKLINTIVNNINGLFINSFPRILVNIINFNTVLNYMINRAKAVIYNLIIKLLLIIISVKNERLLLGSKHSILNQLTLQL